MFKVVINIFFCMLLLTACRKDIGKLPKSDLQETEQVLEEACFPNYQNFSNCSTDSLQYQSLWHLEPSGGFNFLSFYGRKSVKTFLPHPTNQNIFFYLTDENPLSDYSYLWKFDRSNNTKTFIDKGIMSHLSIGNNDWILYTKKDNCSYKIKSDGTGIKKLGQGGANFMNDNDYYVIGYNKYKISDDAFIDTLPLYAIHYGKNYMYTYSFENDEFYGSILRYNYQTYSKEFALNINDVKSNLPQGDVILAFIPSCNEKELIWVTQYGGVYKTEIITKTTTKLFSGYTARTFYSAFSQSKINGNFYRVKRTLYTTNNNQNLVDSNEVFEFNRDFTCRRKIILPD